MTPRDPISENMAFLNGKPTKAFIYQDHDAHIAVHTSMMQDPLLMAQIGQNPMAQKMMAARKRVGLVTTATATHATPAGFVVTVTSRLVLRPRN